METKRTSEILENFYQSIVRQISIDSSVQTYGHLSSLEWKLLELQHFSWTLSYYLLHRSWRETFSSASYISSVWSCVTDRDWRSILECLLNMNPYRTRKLFLDQFKKSRVPQRHAWEVMKPCCHGNRNGHRQEQNIWEIRILFGWSVFKW